VPLLLRIVAGIVAVDAMIVAGLLLSAMFAKRRARRELRELERLWSVSAFAATVSSPRAGSRRVAVVVVVASIALWSATVTSPQARHMITSALRPTVDDVAGESGRADRTPSLSDGSPLTSQAGASFDLPMEGAGSFKGAQPPPTASGGRTAPDAPTRPVQGPPKVFGTPSSATVIEVAWSDVSGEIGYRVERSLDADVGWVEVATTLAGVTSYVDDGLVPGTTYFYRVFATAAEGDSPPSDVVSATTAETPAVPTTVVAVSGAPDQIDLSWADGADETGYRIERSADGLTGWSAIATTGQDVTTYSDSGLAPETAYYYRIVAVGAYGESAPSDVVTATTSAHPLSHDDDAAPAPDVSG
jgi:Fibronectin type III domain